MLLALVVVIALLAALVLGAPLVYVMYAHFYYRDHRQKVAPPLPLLSLKESPHVHLSMTTIPERFESDWFAQNLRENLTTLKGNFTLWCNVPPRFEKTGEPYRVTPEVHALLQEFPNFKLYHCSQDWGPVTKILGSVENPDIPMNAPILVVDDDIRYKADVVLHTATHFQNNPDKVYTFCKDGIRGYLGWVASKRLCLGIDQNMPPSCFRIDDDLLDQHFKGRMTILPYYGTMDHFCSVNKDVHDNATPTWENALKYDWRPPMQRKCKKDYWSHQYWLTDDPPATFKPKVAICMWYNKGIKDYADLAAQLNQHFCDKFGYDLIVSDQNRIKETTKKKLSTFDGYAFQRFPLLLETLNTGEYDYVMWVDADAAFCPEIREDKLKKLLYSYQSLDFIFSRDYAKDPDINSGVIIAKNTDFSKQMLQNWGFADESHTFNCVEKGFEYFSIGSDQGCIRYNYAKNINNLQKRSVIIPYGQLQVFGFETEKHPHALIVHAAGMSREERKEIFSTMVSNIGFIPMK